jgi:hypothetical protein
MIFLGGLLYTLYIPMLSMNNISKNNLLLNFMLWIVKNPEHKWSGTCRPFYAFVDCLFSSVEVLLWRSKLLPVALSCLKLAWALKKRGQSFFSVLLVRWSSEARASSRCCWCVEADGGSAGVGHHGQCTSLETDACHSEGQRSTALCTSLPALDENPEASTVLPG